MYIICGKQKETERNKKIYECQQSSINQSLFLEAPLVRQADEELKKGLFLRQMSMCIQKKEMALT